MTLQDLIDSYRAQSGDLPERRWCEDPMLTLYANEAQVEACRRGLLLVQSSTAQLRAGDESVELAAHVLRLTRANVLGTPQPAPGPQGRRLAPPEPGKQPNQPKELK